MSDEVLQSPGCQCRSLAHGVVAGSPRSDRRRLDAQVRSYWSVRSGVRCRDLVEDAVTVDHSVRCAASGPAVTKGPSAGSADGA